MNRLTIALGAVIAITAMLAIPNAPAHFARASVAVAAQRIQDIPPNKLVERDLGVVQPLAQLQALRLDSALTRTRLVVLLAVTLIVAHQIRSVQQQQAFKINPHQAAAFHVARTLHNFLQASQHYFNNILQH